MRLDSNISKDINYNNIQSKSSTEPNINLKKIKNNNSQSPNHLYYFPEKEKEKKDAIAIDLDYNKNIKELIPKDLMKIMTYISPIPKKNLPKKKAIIEKLTQEKEESYEEKSEDNFSKEGDSFMDGIDLEDLKQNDEIKDLNNKEGKYIKINNINFICEENNEQKITGILNKTFSYNIKGNKNKV